MCFKDFRQLVPHAMSVGANMFGVFMPTGTPRAGARSIPMENDLLNFFLYFLIKREARVIAGRLPFPICKTRVIEGTSLFN
jgi:hypothetical protein